MKKLFFCVLFAASPLAAQVDLFTGLEPKPRPAEMPANVEAEAEMIPIPALPPLPESPGEPSFIIVLGKDAVPPLPYSPNLRGYKGLIDWKEVPDLGYNKEEIQEIAILQREQSFAEDGSRLFSPSVWHFKAETWETIYNGPIPYLEELMFLDDEFRVRLSTRFNRKQSQSAEGYLKDNKTGDFGFYQAVNTPSPEAVSRIILVSAADNQAVKRLQAAFEKASDKAPIVKPPADPLLGEAAPYAGAPLGQTTALPSGVSIFEKAQ